ncbi:DHS-like NAD/FAD-binding domain-containing protein [Lactifluus subvellereus]|nr:DHS-like NAD/FAD-binding domain-containing protein [Lactifluus subvellereus]
MFPPSKFRAPSVSLVRSRSSPATTPSFLGARDRVKEPARKISSSSTDNAVVSRVIPTHPASIPAFQQLPSKTNLPIPAPALPSCLDTSLDHSFMGMSGAQIFHEMIIRHDVKQIFGYPGGAIMPVFDAIYNSKHFDLSFPDTSRVLDICGGLCARIGKPGVVLVTSGPGATNIVTPLQDALAMASLGERDGRNPAPLPFNATTPGWSLDLPENPLQVPIRPSSELEVIRQAAELINQAERPLIYAGHGVLANPLGPKFLTQLARQGNIPVTTTLHGLGVFDETDPRSLHMVGMHGSAYANFAMQKADVIVALGARFDDRVTGKVSQFAPASRAAAAQGRGGIIHFEIQRKNLNKVVNATVPILGDVTENLAAILPLIKFSERAAWFKDINEWKEKYPFAYVKSNPEKGEKMKTQEVIEELDRQVAPYKENVIITTGVGQHQMWAAQHFRWRYPRSMITSGGLGTMGFGLPSAVGAKVAAPNKMLVTASHYNIGVKVLILNNDFQGMVRQWQDLFYGGRYSHARTTNPDFVLLAKAMGAHGIRASNAGELPEKMKEF